MGETQTTDPGKEEVDISKPQFLEAAKHKKLLKKGPSGGSKPFHLKI